jgi:kinesin family protein 18/19
MGKRVKDQTFGFDRVFDENTTQVEVYESTTKGLLDSVLDGFNATVFAYGATGCGKTHTITGTKSDPGIIFLTLQELFEKIDDRKDEKQTEVSLSYLEIYNETIRDLLVPGGSKQGLMLREDANQTVSVANLSSHHPKDVHEVMDMIFRGNGYRTISPTEANATSSRSHAVLQVNVAQKDRNAAVNEPHTMATLSIIDLAGSERASATKNRGERLLEGANINKSLLALGSCINALCDPRKKNHVPYRNSKLTRLLKFSLGGNCKTVMIVCVSPSSAHFDETQNTLRYANRAKNIQTKVTRNVYNVNRHVKDFLVKIDEQLAMINELKAQQKDAEGTAFIKFRKMNEKRDAIAREGVVRIRAAYENSAAERQEKLNNMKKLRLIERRIGMLSAWIAAFDSICESREDEEMPQSLATMRKTALGIQIELESSRQHYHQLLQKGNWERAIDSAVNNSIRQLGETDATGDASDVATLTREADLLKANAEREAYREVSELDKGADAAIMQVLLSAHFDTIASLNDILNMDEVQAVQHAKTVLGRLLKACSTAASHVIKPDGSLVPTEMFPPTKNGTPKRKKQVNMLGGETRSAVPMPALAAAAPQVFASPLKASPRRRKPVATKKGLTYTPKKKSPTKRSVKWRDDTESGSLAEFEKTPQRYDDTPEQDPTEKVMVPPTLPSYLAESAYTDESLDSSPIPAAPQPSIDLKPKSNRFQAGFLSKKSDNTPTPPKMTSLNSDSDVSPLRNIDPSKTNNRTSPRVTEIAVNQSSPESANSSDSENSTWTADKGDSAKIRTALKRASISNRSGHSHATGTEAPRRRARSPPSGTTAGSPPNENQLFTASHARRMIKSEKGGDLVSSVLSPRTAPVVKTTARRTTIEGRHAAPMLSAVQAVRLSGTAGGKPREREGVVNKGVSGWR